MTVLRLILGDQLNHQLSSLRYINLQTDIVLMAEVGAEVTYVKHHKRKIAFLFAAMRHFAEMLRDDGVSVIYCRDCHYKVSQKNGLAACPFNYLYWDFLIRNRSKLKDNARLGMMYRSLDRMDEVKIAAIRHDADQFLARLPEA